MKPTLSLLLPFSLAACLTSCVGTTGSGLVDFAAFASGPPGVTRAFEFDTSAGAHVTLTTAQMHIGAVYLVQSPVNTSSVNTSCTDPGVYVAEVPGSIDVDVLSPTPQPFQIRGTGTADRALTGEVWLAGADVNATAVSTVIVDVAGTATEGGLTYPFEAKVTIGQNRAIPASDPSQPGLNPICKRRIVPSIPADTRPFEGGALFLQIDPRRWFTNVAFSKLDRSNPPPYSIPDTDDDPVGRNLFLGVRASAGVYSFDFRKP